MTREEAIEILTDNWTTIDNSRYSSDELNEAFDMAIRALKNEQTDGDLVSRNAVLDLVADYNLSMGQVVKGIHALPSYSAKENTAEWIHVRDVLGDYFRCSNCYNCKNIPANFCDHCGYKMSIRKEMKGDTE